MGAYPIDLFDHRFYTSLVTSFFAGINLVPGMVEAVGAVVGAASAGHKMLNWAVAGRGMLAVDQVPIRPRQVTQLSDERADRILYNFTINLEPPAWDIRVKTAIPQGIG